MRHIKVRTPAKINLTLEVLNKRADGFHNIQSIMQAINLYDYLDVTVKNSDRLKISLSGSSKQIPYDERNLVWKAAELYLKKTGIKNKELSVYIEKNIPVEAGLAGGSTNAAGMFFAMNEVFDRVLSEQDIQDLCASLGSDLNFCLSGGTALCTSRGEKTEKLPSPDLDISLIKPVGFGISAKEAYSKFSKMKDKSIPDNTHKMTELLKKGLFDTNLFYNSLEHAVINDYPELIEIKNSIKNSMMSGSGPTFFVPAKQITREFTDRFIVINGLKTISTGVEVC